MLRFSLFLALNVGGAAGWWICEPLGIWIALLGGAAGSVAAIWLVWRHRDSFGG